MTFWRYLLLLATYSTLWIVEARVWGVCHNQGEMLQLRYLGFCGQGVRTGTPEQKQHSGTATKTKAKRKLM